MKPPPPADFRPEPSPRLKRAAPLSGISLAAIILLLLGAACRDRQVFLRASGDQIIDASGRAVLLRGLNLEFKDFKSVLGEKDLEQIAEMGANTVRLVLDYRDLETASHADQRGGFRLLDTVIGWCGNFGLFVILDLHLAPGIQNPHDFVVHREEAYRFWEDAEFQERFYEVWEAIAGRYAQNTVVAGYDLLNEGAPPSVDLYRTVMNRAASRIRKLDKNHILIVEEAILPGWKKELVRIDDSNALYSIHFFHPPQFTFYATTTGRPVTTYPGEMVTAGEAIAETRSETIRGTTGWRKMTLTARPPRDAEVFVVSIVSRRNRGIVWVDDVSLEIDGQPVDLPAPLVKNSSFETDYPGFHWSTSGSGAKVKTETARTGAYALSLSGGASRAAARSSPIEVRKGAYVLAAWYRADQATGETYLSLSWHRRKVIARLSRDVLRQQIDYALRFREKNRVPLYVGEFTAHVSPWPESSARYLQDLLAIFSEERLHWSFWEYYSVYPGVGIFTGSPPSVINRTAYEVLTGTLHSRPSAPAF